MNKKILCLASNYGLWAEELQAPWDALKNAGFELTLATKFGKTPLPMVISMDAEMIDPKQNYKVNPPEVVNRVNELLQNGEWNNPIKIEEANMNDFDAIVMVGGPGSPLDITGNPFVHRLLLEAFQSKKVIGAICYTMAALAQTRNPENNNKSIIWGKKVCAHPHAWDFDSDLSYDLVNTIPENKGTDLVTQGFVFPLQYLVEDAAGPNGTVLADETANREKPCVAYDFPFVTALSVESSMAYGKLLVEVLSK
ncbi:MAG: type 1 glutamine amidotransferase domain-containing protein [Bacteroidota bacterium]|nr:type 1 glutamine amidotransferase domain-containing protein [Bacteroidota bacterium]